MEDRIRDILSGLPSKPPRSSLEPYRDLIKELRRLGRTYREIAQIFAEQCQLRVSPSTVFRFVRAQARRNAQSQSRQALKSARTKGLNPPAQPEHRTAANTADQENRKSAEVQQRIAALKLRSFPAQSSPGPFRYDPNEPLRLPSNTEKNKSGE